MWGFEVQKPFPKSFKTSSKQVWKWQDLETKIQIEVNDRDAYVDEEIPYNELGWKGLLKIMEITQWVLRKLLLQKKNGLWK